MSVQCAQITPLTGGKKDTMPPKPILFLPENASVNFNSKTIEIQFDEYIALKDIANQFIITPQLNESPEIIVIGKKLKITFRQSLQQNTTYKLAFGNAITDINESNVLQNFEYLFSTGNILDSLSIRGKVVLFNNKKPVSQVLIGLYPNNSSDSIIYNSKPLYITKTNDLGIFKFNYLPNETFKIVAIKDINKNLVYDGSDEEIAFNKNLVNPTDTIFTTLYLFKEPSQKNFIKKSYSPEYGKAMIIFNKPQLYIKQIKANGLIKYDFNTSKDTLSLYYTNQYDTLQTYIINELGNTDTVYTKIMPKELLEKQKNNKLIKYSITPSFSSFLPYFELPVFNLNVPVKSKNIDKNKILLIEKLDSLSKLIPFNIITKDDWASTFKINADFQADKNYILYFKNGALIDDSKRYNDSVSYKFKTTSEDDYATLKIKIIFPKKENYLVRLLNEKEELINEQILQLSLTSTSEKIIEYKNLIPGNYFVRVVEDANKNGLFDTGNYFLKIYPETIFINNAIIKLLPGWEIENEFKLK